jgi:peroxiredoxin
MSNQILEKGTPAPDFELFSTAEQKTSLKDFKGRKLIMAFYPADWSPVCSDQMALYNETMKFFEEYNAALVGISVDSKWCHFAFSENRKLHFPLLADFEPKGEISRKYGVYNETEGTSERALFIIDELGTIQWSYLSPVGLNPGADGILDALEEMSQVKSE